MSQSIQSKLTVYGEAAQDLSSSGVQRHTRVPLGGTAAFVRERCHKVLKGMRRRQRAEDVAKSR